METAESVLYNLKYLKHLVFEVTDSCNLNCRYCGLSQFYEGYDNRTGNNLSYKQIKMVIDYIFSLRTYPEGVNYPLTISFYGGEPLLNMGLIEKVIGYISNSNFPMVNYGITTNALLLNKYMDFLVEKKFDLTISLDGDKTSHSYRVDHSGKNSFERVFRNVKLLQKKYPEYFEKKVLFNSVLHNRNEVESTYKFIKNQFDKIPIIASLNTNGIKKDKIQEFRRMYQNVSESIKKSDNCQEIEAEMFIYFPKISQLSKYIFKHSGNAFNDLNDLIFNTSGISSRQTGTCSPFEKKMFITVNGKILQCERIPQNFVLGQVFDDRIELEAKKIADKQNQYISAISKQCAKCYLKNECPQCIYYIEGLNKNLPKCKYFSTKSDYMLYKESMIDCLKEHPDFYEKMIKQVTVIY